MKSKTALVFDDNAECRTFLTEVLAEKQYDVVSFSDPNSFLAQRDKKCCHMVTEPCFDIILTDNQMPGMTGVEFLQMLKGNECKLSDSRKGIISGSWASEDLAKVKQLGCRVFSKPVALDEIYEWLDSLRD